MKRSCSNMKIGCLHAHYSNIEYLERSITSDQLQWVHFVDPGLITRMALDMDFDVSQGKAKVIDQLDWIAQSKVDAILITCTNYVALLEEIDVRNTIPILKIDEPYFEYICGLKEPHTIWFANPVTVDGTMTRLRQYAAARGVSLAHVESLIIENSFHLFMQGNKDHYSEKIASSIREWLTSDGSRTCSVAQLSMVDAAVGLGSELSIPIGNPLDSLKAYLIDMGMI
jgi:hypothetical protein